MSEIRNLTRNGETFFPLTCTDAIVNRNGSYAIDDVPTAGSDNLVKSGGVYSAIDTLPLFSESFGSPTKVGSSWYYTVKDNPLVIGGKYLLKLENLSASALSASRISVRLNRTRYLDGDDIVKEFNFTDLSEPLQVLFDCDVNPSDAPYILIACKTESGQPVFDTNFYEGTRYDIEKLYSEVDDIKNTNVYKAFDVIFQRDFSYEFYSDGQTTCGRCKVHIGYHHDYTIGYANFEEEVKELAIFGDSEHIEQGVADTLVYDLPNFGYLVARLSNNKEYMKLAIADYETLKKSDVLLFYCAYGKAYGPIAERKDFSNLKEIVEKESTGIPSYYDSYLASIEAKLEEKIISLGYRNDALFFFTDVHTILDGDNNNTFNSGKVIGELMKKTNINKAVFGGDIVPAMGSRQNMIDAMSDYTSQWYRCIAPYGKLYSVKGNHDFHITDNGSRITLPQKSARNYYMGRQSMDAGLHYDNNNQESVYFYTDNQGQKIRYLFVDTMDTVEWTFSKPQSDFFYSAIVNAPSNYGIVVIGHIPACETNEPCIQTLADFLGGFKNKQSVTVNNTVYDFTNVGAELLFMLAGHEHRDDFVAYKNVPYFITACDTLVRDYKVGQFGETSDFPDKKRGTIYEVTFDALLIDIENSTVQMIRIGGGYDRICHFDVRKVNVGSFVQLQTTVTNPEWLDCDGTGNYYGGWDSETGLYIYENRHTKVSVNNGMVTGLSSGNALVCARNRTSKIMEIFVIEVV